MNKEVRDAFRVHYKWTALIERESTSLNGHTGRLRSNAP